AGRFARRPGGKPPRRLTSARKDNQGLRHSARSGTDPLPASPKIANDFGGGAGDALRGMSAPADVRSKGHAMICV
ncbi:hypothetical protein, partial [Bellilinea sp.]|uniref:hypothetical protein n=1 Tax=Bellilinea sp. TaxID=2838785 RepID=UPI002ADDD8C8